VENSWVPGDMGHRTGILPTESVSAFAPIYSNATPYYDQIEQFRTGQAQTMDMTSSPYYKNNPSSTNRIDIPYSQKRVVGGEGCTELLGSKEWQNEPANCWQQNQGPNMENSSFSYIPGRQGGQGSNVENSEFQPNQNNTWNQKHHSVPNNSNIIRCEDSFTSNNNSNTNVRRNFGTESQVDHLSTVNSSASRNNQTGFTQTSTTSILNGGRNTDSKHPQRSSSVATPAKYHAKVAEPFETSTGEYTAWFGQRTAEHENRKAMVNNLLYRAETSDSETD